MNVIRTAVRVFSARAASAAVVFIGFALFARSLGATVFGVFVLFHALLSLIGVGVDLGVGHATEKRLSEEGSHVHSGSLLTTAFGIKLCLFAVVSVLVLVFASPLNEYLGRPLAPLLVPVLACQQLGWLLTDALRGELKVDRAEYLEFGQQIVFVIAGFGLIAAGYGVLGPIYGFAIGWGAASLSAFFLLSTRPTRPSIEAAISLLKFSMYDSIASVLRSSLYSWVDVIIIGLFLTQRHVAAYEMAWRVAAAIGIFSYSIALTLFPRVSDLSSRETLENVETLIPDAMVGSLLFVVPAIVGGWLVGYPMLDLLFGSKYTIASTALIVLLVGKIPEAVNHVYRPVLLGLNRPDLAARSTLLFLILNVGLNVLLIPRYNLVGAAVATSTAYAIHTVLNRRYLSRYVYIETWTWEHGIFAGAAMVMGIVLWGLQRLFTLDSLPMLLVVIGISAGVYGVTLISVPQLRSRMRQLIS